MVEGIKIKNYRLGLQVLNKKLQEQLVITPCVSFILMTFVLLLQISHVVPYPTISTYFNFSQCVSTEQNTSHSTRKIDQTSFALPLPQIHTLTHTHTTTTSLLSWKQRKARLWRSCQHKCCCCWVWCCMIVVVVLLVILFPLLIRCNDHCKPMSALESLFAFCP